ncbi:MAG: hydrogenase maturation protease [Rhodobacter sp.]|nr:hydrogenase maturation protease [Rhodobacter sp.]
MTKAAPLHIGIGNPFRRDDGVGPWLAARLAEHGLSTMAHEGDGTRLIDLFQTHPEIVILDASRSGARPGTLAEFDAIADAVPAEFFHYSTHRFGVAEAVETARVLGLLPRSLLLFAIEGMDFSHGEGLSPAVTEAAKTLLHRLVNR